MSTGRRAYPDNDGMKLWHSILNVDPVPPRQIQPLLSARLERIVLCCMAKEPSRRYGTTRELADALRSVRARGLSALIRRIWPR
jgi:hypothetical protein